jgi:Tol biopolymer transport system component
VYFTTAMARSERIWRVNADGTARRLVFQAPVRGFIDSVLSPDGRWFLLTTRGGSRLSVMTADGHRLHTVTSFPDAADMSPTAEWSPRGDRLLVDDQGSSPVDTFAYPAVARSSVYTVPADGGPRHYLPLPRLGVWSPDERFVAYSTAAPLSPRGPTHEKVVIVSVATGRARKLLTASLPNPPADTSFDDLAVRDWQAVPGTTRPTRCDDGPPRL